MINQLISQNDLLPEEIAIAMKKGIALAIIGNKKLARNVSYKKELSHLVRANNGLFNSRSNEELNPAGMTLTFEFVD